MILGPFAALFGLIVYLQSRITNKRWLNRMFDYINLKTNLKETTNSSNGQSATNPIARSRTSCLRTSHFPPPTCAKSQGSSIANSCICLCGMCGHVNMCICRPRGNVLHFFSTLVNIAFLLLPHVLHNIAHVNVPPLGGES